MPVGEFFWANFLRRVKREWGLEGNFDSYRHWDLDLIVAGPNMDPHLTGIQVVEDTTERKLVKTGFGALIERRRTLPMPHFRS